MPFRNVAVSFSTLCSIFLAGYLVLPAGCSLQTEIIFISSAFECDTDSQCPADTTCGNYFDVYLNSIDTRAQPVGHGVWGICLSKADYDFIENSELALERCDNGRDDDNNGLTDCLDLQCQTAPPCRAFMAETCPEGATGSICDGRLGFPLVRNSGLDMDLACPKSVGHRVTSVDGAEFCLPRCRLYFNQTSSGTENHIDADFLGSDDYCDLVAPMYATDGSFRGSLRCQQLGTGQSRFGRTYQNDACLPETPDLVVDTPTSGQITETCLSVCSSTSCLRVQYVQRTWTTLDFDSTPVMIPGNDPERYVQTAFYCLD